MKKLWVLIYIAAMTFLFGYAKAMVYPVAWSLSPEGSELSAEKYVSVDFEQISAKVLDNKVEIKWSTLKETNNKQFEIQRSLDGLTFKTIALWFTLEDSHEIKHYTFLDELKGVEEKQLAYRIKQVDTGEVSSYSIVVSASR